MVSALSAFRGDKLLHAFRGGELLSALSTSKGDRLLSAFKGNNCIFIICSLGIGLVGLRLSLVHLALGECDSA